MSIPRDVQEFIDEYPRNGNDANSSENLFFYSNTLRCRPDNKLIDDIHKQWLGDYDKLEYKHGFIQWLFPIREHGMNYESQSLQPHEIEAMKSDPAIVERIIQSYKLMLDFYGMRLVSVESGLVDRALPPRNYSARYNNLVRKSSPPYASFSKMNSLGSVDEPKGSSHNYLRISRILKCLSEMGLEHLNAGFLLHILAEQSESNELNSPRIRSSMDRWWANCLRNEDERRWINDMIKKVRGSQGAFVFTRRMYKNALQVRAKTRTLDLGEDESIDTDFRVDSS